MNIDTDILLNSCLEIEGLICLLSKRGDSYPQAVITLLEQKSEAFHDAVAEFCHSQINQGQDIKEVNEQNVNVESEATAAQDISDHDVPVLKIETADAESNEIADAAEFEETEDADVSSTEADLLIEDTEVDETVLNQNEFEGPIPGLSFFNEDVASVSKTHETKKEVASHIPATTVRNDKVAVELTINDKFRFRKELFANSDVDLAEALQVVSQMNTLAEVEDYCYNDLCFDPEKDVVKDFIRIVTSRL